VGSVGGNLSPSNWVHDNERLFTNHIRAVSLCTDVKKWILKHSSSILTLLWGLPTVRFLLLNHLRAGMIKQTQMFHWLTNNWFLTRDFFEVFFSTINPGWICILKKIIFDWFQSNGTVCGYTQSEN